MIISEEQALQVLRMHAESRKKPLAKLRVLRGFTPQPQPPAKHKPQTAEDNLIALYKVTLEKLRLTGKGYELDLENYPVMPKGTRTKSALSSQVRKELLIVEPYCAYCPSPAKTIDHVLPKMRGGTNSLANLVTCCLACNSNKSSFLPKELGWKLRLPLRAFDYELNGVKVD